MRTRSSLALCLVICVAYGAADADRYAVDRLPELLGDTSSPGPYIEVDIASGPMAEWTLAEIVTIGSSADGEDEVQADFFQVITDIQLLGDGRIAILDSADPGGEARTASQRRLTSLAASNRMKSEGVSSAAIWSILMIAAASASYALLLHEQLDARIGRRGSRKSRRSRDPETARAMVRIREVSPDFWPRSSPTHPAEST